MKQIIRKGQDMIETEVAQTATAEQNIGKQSLDQLNEHVNL